MELSDILVVSVAGILVGLPTGPARFFVVDTRLRSGKTAGFLNYAGFFAALVPYAVVALVADDYLSRHPKFESLSHTIASLILLFWGVFILYKSRTSEERSEYGNPTGHPLMKGFLVGISNPVTPFIYLAVLQLLQSKSHEEHLGMKVILLLIFELFGFLTTWLIAGAVSKDKDSIQPFWRRIKLGVGIVLIILGLIGLL